MSNLNSSLAPVCIFVYNRPQHTEKMLKSLMSNILFEESKIVIFADGAKENATKEELEKIKLVRKLFDVLKEKKNISLSFSDINLGLTKSIVSGITEIINEYGKVIVVEDDLELSPGFLNYMNDALNLYENEEKVMHVGGYMVPHNLNLPDTFFLRTPTIWGWGTWKRAWNKFELDASLLLKNLELKLGEDFAFELDVNGTYNYAKQLKDIASGKLDTWDIQWAASIYLLDGLCLHPKTSLARNNGFDGSGVHCYPSEIYKKQNWVNSVAVYQEKIEPSKLGMKALMEFYKSKNKPSLQEEITHIYNKLLAAIPKEIKSEVKKIIRK